MSKILVAGAGHGGLVAAAYLAKAGHDVCVFEKKNEDELGHDWEDRFSFPVLCDILGVNEDDLPKDSWRFRGDCSFVSPAKRKRIDIRYSDADRQKIMWRKPLIGMLIDNAKKAGVKFYFGTTVNGPVFMNNKVIGLLTSLGNATGDLVVDACGVFSPIRSSLPAEMGIEKSPKYGDLFFGYRAYYEKDKNKQVPDIPFEVYLYHEGEQGLSWLNTNEDTVDILIGRIYELTKDKVKEQIDIFKNSHPWFSDKIINGGNFAVIPVRRPLTLMVADGYAAVGDSAFMTTPMNGMGIDLSMHAGKLLAECVIEANTDSYTAEVLWNYNREYHILYGGDTSKNAGLKNAILSMPSVGVDFLYENDVIQSSDLAGGGKNVKVSALLGKFVRGMRNPKYFFAIIKGLIKGAKVSKLYKKAPERFNLEEIKQWSKSIEAFDVTFERTEAVNE